MDSPTARTNCRFCCLSWFWQLTTLLPAHWIMVKPQERIDSEFCFFFFKICIRVFIYSCEYVLPLQESSGTACSFSPPWERNPMCSCPYPLSHLPGPKLTQNPWCFVSLPSTLLTDEFLTSGLFLSIWMVFVFLASPLCTDCCVNLLPCFPICPPGGFCYLPLFWALSAQGSFGGTSRLHLDWKLGPAGSVQYSVVPAFRLLPSLSSYSDVLRWWTEMWKCDPISPLLPNMLWSSRQ